MKTLFISADTLRGDRLDTSGYPRGLTPNLTRFGNEGVVFTNAVATDIPTQPSHTSVFTGRYGLNTGIVSHFLPGVNLDTSTPWLPSIFQSTGCATGAVDHLFSMKDWFIRGYGDYINPPGRSRSPAWAINDLAFPWLAKHRDEDFFFFIHYWDPHIPYVPPLEFRKRFTADTYAWVDPLLQQRLKSRPSYLLFKQNHYDHLDCIPNLGYVADLYDAEVAYLDHEIGRLFSFLEGLGILDETAIVLFGDHGENMAEHDAWFDHAGLYDSVVHVPLLMRAPGRVRPGVCSAQVALIDVMPTVLELCGLPAVEPSDGRSLLPLIRGEAEPHRSSVMLSEATWQAKRGIRTDRWKYIRSYHPGIYPAPTVELYDRTADPGETSNRALDYPDIVESMNAELEGWLSDQLGNRPDPFVEVIRRGLPAVRRLESVCQEEHSRLAELGAIALGEGAPDSGKSRAPERVLEAFPAPLPPTAELGPGSAVLPSAVPGSAVPGSPGPGSPGPGSAALVPRDDPVPAALNPTNNGHNPASTVWVWSSAPAIAPPPDSRSVPPTAPRGQLYPAAPTTQGSLTTNGGTRGSNAALARLPKPPYRTPHASARQLVIALIMLVLAVNAVLVTWWAIGNSNSFAGQVQALHSASVNFATNGRLDAIAAVPGDHVHKGQVLARQDDTAAQQALTAAKAVLAADQAKLNALENPSINSAQAMQQEAMIGQAQSALASAQTALADAQSVAGATTTSATATAQTDQATVASDQAQFDASCPGGVPPLPPDPTSAETAASAACLSLQSQLRKDSAALAQDQANLALAQAQGKQNQDHAAAAVASSQDAVNLAKDQLAVMTAPAAASDIAQAEAGVANDQAQVVADEQNLRAQVLVAPFDGKITSVGGSAGDLAGATGVQLFGGLPAIQQNTPSFSLFPQSNQGTTNSAAPATVPLFTLDRSNSREVAVQVPEGSIAQFARGTKVSVYLNALGISVPGRVVDIVSTPLRNQGGPVLYEVTARVSHPVRRMVSGMSASVTLDKP